MSGWIYCITNSLYKMDDVYKIGYTANKQNEDLVKHHLFQRYGTYFPDVECIDLFEVKQPIQAEKQLFELLKDYKYSNELFKADYDMTIKPQLQYIKREYCCEKTRRVFTDLEKRKCKAKLKSKINKILKNCPQIQNFLSSSMHKASLQNCQLLSNVFNYLSYYNSMLFQNQDKKMMSIYKNQVIRDLTMDIERFDYDDSEIFQFTEFVANI